MPLAALKIHCREAALVVRDFSGGWLSKARHEQQAGAVIEEEEVRDFVHGAVTKLVAELKQGAG